MTRPVRADSQLKVLQAVIVALTVQMMYLLIVTQAATEMLSHHNAMFENI